MRLFSLLLISLSLCAKDVTVTILATTDLHGNIFPYDYLAGKPAQRGLAKIATLVKNERKSAPAALLVDCGDTIQGAPLESVYQQFVESGKLPAGLTIESGSLPIDPMMAAMNYLRYDAMAVGNHEFNYGLKNLDKARSEARFPWLSANTQGGGKPFEPYVVKDVDGVKVALIGITTPGIPSWEKPENYSGYTFLDGKVALLRTVAEVRSKHHPDLIIVLAHAGLEGSAPSTPPKENMVEDLAQVDGVDAIVFGHTHNQLEGRMLGKVLVAQSKNWGMSLVRMDIKLSSKPGGRFSVDSKTSRIILATDAVEPDQEVLKIAKPYHELTERYLNTVVAQANTNLDARASRVEDTALIDAIQQAQLYYSKADVSFASSFNPAAAIPKGPVTIRQVAALYLYDNELYAIEGTGKMVKDALENAARYYRSCTDDACGKSPLINSSVIGYNYDMAEGVSYEIDLTRPEGDRVRNLIYKGKPLDPAQKLRIALNNYRAGGSAGYTMFQGAKQVWRSYDEIRDLIIRYYAERPLPSTPTNNWRVVPETAHRTLVAETQRSVRPQTQ